MKERKRYEKPTVIFEKDLEGLAGDCDPVGNTVYSGDEPGYCKADGICILVSS